MRKIIIGLLNCLLLIGCNGSSAQTEPSPTLEGSFGIEETATPDANTQETSLIDEYISQIEDYELLRYAFLGTMEEEDGLKEVLDRASSFPGFEFLNELSENDAVYGEPSEYYNVYLLIPKKGCNLQVGPYSWYADQMTEILYESNEGKPILYIETSDDTRYYGQIKIDNDMTLFTGFNIATSKLRTDFKMGVVDVTPYEQFTSAEIPFFSQAIHDITTQVAEIQKIEQEGGSVTISGEEIIFDDELYALVYTRDKNDKDIIYGVSPSSGSVVKTEDHREWIKVK